MNPAAHLITFVDGVIRYTPPKPGPCGCCKRIAAFFVNRNGSTCCAVCDRETLTPKKS